MELKKKSLQSEGGGGKKMGYVKGKGKKTEMIVMLLQGAFIKSWGRRRK